MKKQIFSILTIFLISLCGGVLGAFLNEQILKDYFIRWGILKKKSENPPVYVQQITKEVKIQENIALKEAISKVEKSVLAIKTQTPKGKIIQGSGIILTSDGLVLTLAELVPQGGKFEIFWDKEKVKFQILKRDLKDNLALIKIEKTGLQTVPFGNLEKLKLGERVFLLASLPGDTLETLNFVNEGIVKKFNQDLIETNIFDKQEIAGSALFDIEGNLLGINKVNIEGNVIAIPLIKIKNFTNL